MAGNGRAPLVYTPGSLQQLLQVYKKNPTAAVHAGGTYAAYQLQTEKKPPDQIIYLGNIEELKKIARTDRYLEIGAGASFNQVLRIGHTLLPPLFLKALQQTASYTVRTLATIGGAIAAPGQRLDLFPALVLLDARVELRKGGSSRWLQPNRLFDDQGNSGIAPGELITRVRLPIETWDRQLYIKVANRSSRDNFIFAGRGKIQKGLIQDFRFCFGGVARGILRDKSIEAEITGKKLPLLPKTIESIVVVLEKRLDAMTEPIYPYQRSRVPVFLREFIEYLSKE